MIIKPVIPDRISEKRRKWATFEDLVETNESLDAAVFILIELKFQITVLPEKLTTSSVEQADSLLGSVILMEASLDKFIDSTNVHFGEIEIKLEEMEKSLLHDEICNSGSFSKLLSEVRYSQKLIDALIGNAEEEIYRFLECEGLYLGRKKRYQDNTTCFELLFS